MQDTQKLRILIRKMFFESLDWTDNKLKPIDQTFEMNPSRLTRTVEIKGITMIISVLFDNYAKTAHVAFVEKGKSFGDLTGSNVIGQVLSNATIQAIDMIEEFNGILFKNKRQVSLNSFVFTPVKMEDEKHASPLKTKRGRLYKLFIEKYFKVYSFEEHNEDVIASLKWPVILGKNPEIKKTAFLKIAA